MIQLTPKAKQAVAIGSLCSMAYLAVYIARNVLGSVSPQMIEQELFTESEIGSLSSIFFITYAVGQLINGIIGDKVKGKYMISFGLILAGLCNAVFSACSGISAARTAAYALTGFALAIISANCASTMLWSIYCPRLRDTGMVSGATGFLDFASYIAAAVSSTLFSNAVEDIGWGPLILVWCGLMVLGVIVALPRRKTSNN